MPLKSNTRKASRTRVRWRRAKRPVRLRTALAASLLVHSAFLLLQPAMPRPSTNGATPSAANQGNRVVELSVLLMPQNQLPTQPAVVAASPAAATVDAAKAYAKADVSPSQPREASAGPAAVSANPAPRNSVPAVPTAPVRSAPSIQPSAEPRRRPPATADKQACPPCLEAGADQGSCPAP